MEGERASRLLTPAVTYTAWLDIGCSFLADSRERKIAANLPGQTIRNLLMPRHGFNCSSGRVAPQGVFAPFPFEITPVPP